MRNIISLLLISKSPDPALWRLRANSKRPFGMKNVLAVILANNRLWFLGYPQGYV